MVAASPLTANGMANDQSNAQDRCDTDGTAKGGRLNINMARAAFRALVNDCGLPVSPGCRAPRLHDARHSFAVNALLDAHREGVDVDARIATLANWLGHVDPTHTYWYLSASPELMQTVRDRLTAWQETIR